MATTARFKSKRSSHANDIPKHRARKPVRTTATSSKPKADDPNSNAVPFELTVLAAKLFGPPAISDAIEEELPFDISKAQRIGKPKPT